MYMWDADMSRSHVNNNRVIILRISLCSWRWRSPTWSTPDQSMRNSRVHRCKVLDQKRCRRCRCNAMRMRSDENLIRSKERAQLHGQHRLDMVTGNDRHQVVISKAQAPSSFSDVSTSRACVDKVLDGTIASALFRTNAHIGKGGATSPRPLVPPGR